MCCCYFRWLDCRSKHKRTQVWWDLFGCSLSFRVSNEHLGEPQILMVRNFIFPGKLTMFRGIIHFLTQFGVSIGEKTQPNWCAENSLLETFIYPPCTRPIAYLQPKAVRSTMWSTSEALGTPKEEETRSRCPQQLGQPERKTWEVRAIHLGSPDWTEPIQDPLDPLDPAFWCRDWCFWRERMGPVSDVSGQIFLPWWFSISSLWFSLTFADHQSVSPPLNSHWPMVWYPMVPHGQFPPSPMAWLFSDHEVPIGFGLPAGGVTHDRGVGRTVGLGPALGPSSHHRHGQLRSILGLSKTTWVIF